MDAPASRDVCVCVCAPLWDGSVRRCIENQLNTFFSRARASVILTITINRHKHAPQIAGMSARFGHNFVGTWQCIFAFGGNNTHFNFSVFNFRSEHGSAHLPGQTMNKKRSNYQKPCDGTVAAKRIWRRTSHHASCSATFDTESTQSTQGTVCSSCLESGNDRHQWRCMCLFSCLNASLMPMKTPLILSHHFY